jgi:hypothetical protein
MALLNQTMSTPRREIAGVTVPDTPLVAHSMEEARALSEPYLFNHAVRSWLFAVQLAELQGVSYDEEVVAVVSSLHDVGLTREYQGKRRFEVEGADAARALAKGGGVDDRRAQLIWYCVALNATLSISPYQNRRSGSVRPEREPTSPACSTSEFRRRARRAFSPPSFVFR